MYFVGRINPRAFLTGPGSYVIVRVCISYEALARLAPSCILREDSARVGNIYFLRPFNPFLFLRALRTRSPVPVRCIDGPGQKSSSSILSNFSRGQKESCRYLPIPKYLFTKVRYTHSTRMYSYFQIFFGTPSKGIGIFDIRIGR